MKFIKFSDNKDSFNETIRLFWECAKKFLDKQNARIPDCFIDLNIEFHVYCFYIRNQL